MKKIISLVLAAVLTLSLAACGTKNDSKGDQPAAPASALDLLEKVWTSSGTMASAGFWLRRFPNASIRDSSS